VQSAPLPQRGTKPKPGKKKKEKKNDFSSPQNSNNKQKQKTTKKNEILERAQHLKPQD